MRLDSEVVEWLDKLKGMWGSYNKGLRKIAFCETRGAPVIDVTAKREPLLNPTGYTDYATGLDFDPRSIPGVLVDPVPRGLDDSPEVQRRIAEMDSAGDAQPADYTVELDHD